ncbi:O-methyltransferase [Mycobacterium lentiflavum]|uniref:O-methyltransferase n=1 Tax=Mycobacterium lentiflavum TaxID=141349 RepID=A0A0E4H2Q7_MYCLN|nr:methyltransferase [Mycobacterium lentiflavum]CQD24241.1 O-methyltransferase [Mycobacterium lentiflavum]
MRFPALPLPLWLARAVLGARRRALDLADTGVPGQAALFLDVVFGLQKTKIAGLLVSSGLADALGKDARDPVELAHELGLDPDVTIRIISAAVALRLMRLDRRGRARLTKVGAPLRRDHPKSLASWAAYYADPDTAAAYAHLDAQLRDGAQTSGYQRAFGKSLWEYFGDRPDMGAAFAEAMVELTEFDLAGIVRTYPWPKHGVICDIGGGVGHMLAAILDRRPQARGILIDSPEMIGQAEGFLRERGLAERIERRTGDLFGELDARADVYTMKWILHDWGDDACRDILKRVRATMPSGSKLVTIDQHYESGRPDAFTAMADVLMLVFCEGGRERSPRQVHALMRDAGLIPGRVRHFGPTMLVEATAP